MRVLSENEVFDILSEKEYQIFNDKIKIARSMQSGRKLESDFSGNIFINDGVSKWPLHIKIPELKNEVDNMRDEVEK